MYDSRRASIAARGNPGFGKSFIECHKASTNLSTNPYLFVLNRQSVLYPSASSGAQNRRAVASRTIAPKRADGREAPSLACLVLPPAANLADRKQQHARRKQDGWELADQQSRRPEPRPVTAEVPQWVTSRDRKSPTTMTLLIEAMVVEETNAFHARIVGSTGCWVRPGIGPQRA